MRQAGTALVVAGRPASFGALSPAVARDAGCQVACLSGLTMRRTAGVCPGEAETDARDAFTIADATRVMPHTQRSTELADETVAELEAVVGFDDDLAGETNGIGNRLHGLLTRTGTPPAGERVDGSVSGSTGLRKGR
jgi:hypothetical protein